MDLIHTRDCSTEVLANMSPTVASISSDVNGAAVLDACTQLNARLAPYKKSEESQSWEEQVRAAYVARENLNVLGHYEDDGSDLDMEAGRGNMAKYVTAGAGFLEVEVDCHTGDVTILRAELVMDLGKSLNPAIDIGQVCTA